MLCWRIEYDDDDDNIILESLAYFVFFDLLLACITPMAANIKRIHDQKNTKNQNTTTHKHI